MKRFYRDVSLAPAEGGGWQVLLDARVLKSPAKAPFVLPTAALAEAIAQEWREQGDKVSPASMPVMQLAATCVDRVAVQRQGVIDGVAAYGATDLLCYHAEYPQELVRRQARLWQPLLEWADERYQARLHPTAGIVPRSQDPAALQALTLAVAGLDDWRLCGLQNAVSVTGSLVLGLALLERRIDADEAFDLSELDAAFQIEQWGEDAEAAARRAELRRDLDATTRYLRALD